jgi:uncharacterized ferritin-like protein (DUF455 family)
MELRDVALRIVGAETIEGKLAPPPPGLTDSSPGPALRLPRPARPPNLRIAPLSAARVPKKRGMVEPAQRSRILHAFCNHELQAVELFAWAILAFPGAEPDFRRGLLRHVAEEQRHARLYMARMAAFGVVFGDYPVSGYFWSKVKDFTTPLRFICGMTLTFENANLDHTLEYAEAARAAGDEETAALLDRIHVDEVEHVRFGLSWLRRWKDEAQTTAEAYGANVAWPLRLALARGKTFHPEGRKAAGMEDEFIRLLGGAHQESPLETSRP